MFIFCARLLTSRLHVTPRFQMMPYRPLVPCHNAIIKTQTNVLSASLSSVGLFQRLKSRASTVNTGRPKLQTCHRLKKETAVKFLIQSIHCEAIRVEAIQGRYRKSWASAFTSILTFVLSRHVVAAKEPIIMLVQNIRCTRFYRSR